MSRTQGPSAPGGLSGPDVADEMVISDDLVRRAMEIIEKSDIVGRVESWEELARRGPAGRPRTFPVRALLVGLVVVVRLNEPVHLVRVRDVLFRRISPAMRAELGIPDPPAAGDWRGWENTFRNVRSRFHGLLELMDPSDRPKNRRLDEDDFMALFDARAAMRSDADRQEAFDRLHWFGNRLMEASFLMLPRKYRRQWNGSVCVDATVIPAFARPERRTSGGKEKWGKRAVLRRSADPDCGAYVRTKDYRDDGMGPKNAKKFIWGYEASLIVCSHVAVRGEPPLPVLVVAMPPLHRPGREPGRNAVRGLESLRARGHEAGRLAGDNAYSNSKAGDFQLPARALGYDLVMTYRIDQVGIQAESGGFNLVDGRWYCPAMPRDLVEATRDLMGGKIDEDTYQKRIEARRAHEARPKGKPDDDGGQRLMCPAARGAPTAACSLKPRSEAFTGKVTEVRIRPSAELTNNPPKSCTQESVLVPPGIGAKAFQSLPLGTPEHTEVYAGLRAAVEGMNGFLKDSSYQGVGDPQRRRVRGVAAQTVLFAFQVLAGNLRKIDGFLQSMETVQPDRAPRQRRRGWASLDTWLPSAGSDASGRAPPDSG